MADRTPSTFTLEDMKNMRRQMDKADVGPRELIWKMTSEEYKALCSKLGNYDFWLFMHSRGKVIFGSNIFIIDVPEIYQSDFISKSLHEECHRRPYGPDVSLKPTWA